MGWNLSEFLAQVLKKSVQNGGKFRTSITISTWLNLVPPIYLFKPCENVLSLCCMYCIHLAYLKKDKKRYKLIWPLYFNILRIKIFSLCMPFKEKKNPRWCTAKREVCKNKTKKFSCQFIMICNSPQIYSCVRVSWHISWSLHSSGSKNSK